MPISTATGSAKTHLFPIHSRTNSSVTTARPTAAVPDTTSVQTATVAKESKNSDMSTINKARNYAPMQISYLKPKEILPILSQLE